MPSRRPPHDTEGVSGGFIDVADEASIQTAAEQIGSPLDLVIVATGILHDGGRMPEKALRELDGTALARIFQINTIGPALVLKHFAPLLARDRRTVIAACPHGSEASRTIGRVAGTAIGPRRPRST